MSNIEEKTEASAPAAASTKGDAVALVTRALVLLALAGFSVGNALALLAGDGAAGAFLEANRVRSPLRYLMLALVLGGAVSPMLVAALHVQRHRKDPDMPKGLLAVAERLSPFMLAGFIPLLTHPETWQSNPLTFLALTSLLVFGAKQTLELASRHPPLRIEQALAAQVRASFAPLSRAARRIPHLPLSLVLTASLAYVVYFSYVTIVFHQSAYSSFDLGIKNNIFWNTLHGNPFKASITLGPDGPSHFGRHADMLVYFLLPIYYFAQKSETILVLQALFMGAAAVPLYLLASRRLGSVPALVIAGSYLLHPALHGGNLFEFHFIGFGLPLLFGAWAAYERQRLGLAALLGVLTLLTREDVALWVTIFGAYLIVTGTDPKRGLVTVVVSLIYFGLIKFWLMPKFGGEAFADYYEGLPPEGDLTFKGVLVTLIGNPAFTLSTLLKQQKLVFLLQIFLPLALLPLSRPGFLLLALPGFLFTLLSPDYTPLFDIAFQYGAHFLAFAYPGLVLALDDRRRERPATSLAPLLFAVACGTLATSFQFGAVLQQRTAFAGPRPFIFGMTEDGERRREAIAELDEHLPEDAKVACSNLLAPQFSSREDAYDMGQGFFDAEYLIFAIHAPELRDHEKRGIVARLAKGKFGVVKVSGPFALAKRGHSTASNRSLLERLGTSEDAD